jgi:heterodisulfide reductase subunit A
MLEAGRHPEVEILAYTDVVRMKKKGRKFALTVNRKARYVKEDVCNACGLCVAKCPGRAPDVFDTGLRKRTAVYLYFSQGIPAVMTIDPDACIYLTKGKCRVCEKRCDKGAIDFEQKDKKVTLDVDAVIMATGVDLFDPTPLTHYGFGKLKNVITGIQYERLINATGPTGGHLYRPSDGKLAKKVAYVQCVGSRDLNYCDYCSSVCCMYSIKDAMLAREHDPESDSYIFHTDLRNVGKWFQKYERRAAEEYGVNFIRGRIAEIAEDDNKDLVVWYEDTREQKVKSMKMEMVVLATAAMPAKSAKGLAKILGVKTDRYGFVETLPGAPADTTVKGVFACGFCKRPCDIPEAVSQASAAAQRAAAHVKKAVPV